MRIRNPLNGTWVVRRIVGEKGDAGLNVFCDPPSVPVYMTPEDTEAAPDIAVSLRVFSGHDAIIAAGPLQLIPEAGTFALDTGQQVDPATVYYTVTTPGVGGVSPFITITRVGKDVTTYRFRLRSSDALYSATTTLTVVKGVESIPGVSQAVSFVFTRTTTAAAPAGPVGGTFGEPGNVDAPWVDTPPPVADGRFLWMSRAVFSSATPGTPGVWSAPSVISNNARFLFNSAETEPLNPATNITGWVDEADATSVWMAVQTGATDTWVVKRIKGEQGSQGYGMYTATVFRRTALAQGSVTLPDGAGTYEAPLFGSTNGWSMDPPAYAPGFEKLWLSTRVFSEDPAHTSTWSTARVISQNEQVQYAPGPDLPVTESALWQDEIGADSVWMRIRSGAGWVNRRMVGEDGQSSVPAFVFTRTATTAAPPTPGGGVFTNTTPTSNENGWSDTLPPEDPATPFLWMSRRVFDQTVTTYNETPWEAPVLMSSFRDVQYAAGEVSAPAEGSTDWKSDPEAVVGDIVWMRIKTDLGNWAVRRIKGERGEAGLNVYCSPATLTVLGTEGAGATPDALVELKIFEGTTPVSSAGLITLTQAGGTATWTPGATAGANVIGYTPNTGAVQIDYVGPDVTSASATLTSGAYSARFTLLRSNGAVGIPGETTYISTVFKRTTDTTPPDGGVALTGGTLGDPIPDTPVGWGDAPPTTGGSFLWMSRAKFSTTNGGAAPIPPGWSTPALISGSADFIFHPDTGNSNPPAAPVGTSITGEWTQEPVATSVWMAVRYGNTWQVRRMVGESGYSSKVVSAFARTAMGEAAPPIAPNQYAGTYTTPAAPTGWQLTIPALTAGAPRLWMIQRTYSTDPAVDDNWDTRMPIDVNSTTEVMFHAGYPTPKLPGELGANWTVSAEPDSKWMAVRTPGGDWQLTRLSSPEVSVELDKPTHLLHANATATAPYNASSYTVGWNVRYGDEAEPAVVVHVLGSAGLEVGGINTFANTLSIDEVNATAAHVDLLFLVGPAGTDLEVVTTIGLADPAGAFAYATDTATLYAFDVVGNASEVTGPSLVQAIVRRHVVAVVQPGAEGPTGPNGRSLFTYYHNQIAQPGTPAATATDAAITTMGYTTTPDAQNVRWMIVKFAMTVDEAGVNWSSPIRVAWGPDGIAKVPNPSRFIGSHTMGAFIAQAGTPLLMLDLPWQVAVSDLTAPEDADVIQRSVTFEITYTDRITGKSVTEVKGPYANTPWLTSAFANGDTNYVPVLLKGIPAAGTTPGIVITFIEQKTSDTSGLSSQTRYTIGSVLSVGSGTQRGEPVFHSTCRAPNYVTGTISNVLGFYGTISCVDTTSGTVLSSRSFDGQTDDVRYLLPNVPPHIDARVVVTLTGYQHNISWETVIPVADNFPWSTVFDTPYTAYLQVGAAQNLPKVYFADRVDSYVPLPFMFSYMNITGSLTADTAEDSLNFPAGCVDGRASYSTNIKGNAYGYGLGLAPYWFPATGHSPQTLGPLGQGAWVSDPSTAWSAHFSEIDVSYAGISFSGDTQVPAMFSLEDELVGGTIEVDTPDGNGNTFTTVLRIVRSKRVSEVWYALVTGSFANITNDDSCAFRVYPPVGIGWYARRLQLNTSENSQVSYVTAPGRVLEHVPLKKFDSVLHVYGAGNRVLSRWSGGIPPVIRRHPENTDRPLRDYITYPNAEYTAVALQALPAGTNYEISIQPAVSFNVRWQTSDPLNDTVKLALFCLTENFPIPGDFSKENYSYTARDITDATKYATVSYVHGFDNTIAFSVCPYIRYLTRQTKHNTSAATNDQTVYYIGEGFTAYADHAAHPELIKHHDSGNLT